MSAPSDSWGLPEPSPATQPATKAPPRVVKDSWDESSDEDDSADHKQIWDNANKQAPMPEIVTASPTPPTAALAGPMRILKRPPPAQASAVPGSRPASSRPLQEREADYAAARERIFGKDAPSPSPAPATPGRAASKSPLPPQPTVSVSRQPRGPAATAGFSARPPRPASSGTASPNRQPTAPPSPATKSEAGRGAQRRPGPSALPDDDAPPPAS